MRNILTSLAVLVLLAVPATAAAQAPGGNAGVDEYTETIPGGGGSSPSADRDGSGPGGPLSPAQVAALEAEGADGAAAAALAQSTGPDRAQQGTERSNGEPAGDSAGGSIPGALGDAASGSDDGMGVALPIILSLALLAALGFVVARRSGGTATEA